MSKTAGSAFSALALPLGALLSGGCTESAVFPISLDLYARGGTTEATLADGTRLLFDRADLAFGPFYACAGAQAGQTCMAALAEWREAAVIDLLDADPMLVGSLDGYSGRALSYMHDCGIVSLLTTETPLVLGAAEELGGRSLALEGTAELPLAGAPSVPFRIALTIASSEADRGQPVVRSAPGAFDAELHPETSALTATFDSAAWVTGLDLGAFFQDESCNDQSAAVVCAGTTSQDCQSGETEDCAAAGQICAPDRGCQDELVIDDTSEAGRSVAQAVTLGAGLVVVVD